MPKVMLVEDDNNLREIYEARLQAEGYTIVAAKDGEEALVVAKAEKPDLIISDVMMPRISGFEMLDILRNTDGLKDVKVIMLTALGQSDDQQRADRLGADRYLVKSQVTLEDIVKVTHELLQDGTAETAPPAAAAPTPVAADPVAPVPVTNDNPTPTADATTTAQATPMTPDPAIAAPAPEPVAPASATDGQQASDSATDSAQTTSQEEASVEAQIEDFVAGATTDATPAPAATPEAEMTPVDSAQEAPQTAPEVAQTVPEPAPAAQQPEPTPTPAAEAAAPVAADPPAPAADKTEPKPENDNVKIAHKKVIEPLNDTSKPDITTLAAMEEAKEAAQQGPPPPTAVVATDQTGQQATPLTAESQPQATDFAANQQQQTNGEDPNNIAL